MAALVSCAKVSASNYNLTVSPGAVNINPLMYNAVGANYTIRRTLSNVGFNPANAAPQFIQVFGPSFLDVTRSFATICSIASNPSFVFVHEAPICIPDLNAGFLTRNCGDAMGYNGWYKKSISA
ncbi:hypothetical protein C8R48DRAFT_781689 [Suillus tomentosus]|nr:hypothetical protein C8R48DRAFT_781689 [Suillus tomentosus]